MDKNNCQNCEFRIHKIIDKKIFLICYKTSEIITENILQKSCDEHTEIKVDYANFN